MAELEHAETGERIEGELQFAALYKVEGYDEGADEYWGWSVSTLIENKTGRIFGHSTTFRRPHD